MLRRSPRPGGRLKPARPGWWGRNAVKIPSPAVEFNQSGDVGRDFPASGIAGREKEVPTILGVFAIEGSNAGRPCGDGAYGSWRGKRG